MSPQSSSPEHVSVSLDSKIEEAVDSLPEDSLLEDDELSEGLEVVDDKEKSDDEEDEDSTPHVGSEASTTQSPSSAKGAVSNCDEEKIQIVIEEEKMEEERIGGCDELDAKSGRTTNNVNSDGLPPADSPRRDQVLFLYDHHLARLRVA